MTGAVAEDPAAHRASRGVDAATMLTVYLMLLLAVPSNVTITALRSLGRPSFLWGLLLLGWWLLDRMRTPRTDEPPLRRPIRFAAGLLFVVALVSLAAALMRGQPSDQVSPALTGMARLLSWGGVLLVAMDGLQSFADVTRIVRRLAIAGGALGILGIVQLVTSTSFVDGIAALPGLSILDGGIIPRGDFTRASATATHPLEYATALSALLPIAVAAAIYCGFTTGRRSHRLTWWLPVVTITLSSYLAVSRSAIIGFAVVVVAMIPGLPRRYRAVVVVGCSALAAVAVVMVPGLFGTIRGLFFATGSDSSTVSRLVAIERAPEFIATSPIIGNGFGTFLPRYYIFDNQWLLLTVELGIVGVAAFVLMMCGAIWCAYRVSSIVREPAMSVMGRSLAASLLAIAVLFAFFDGLSFPISSGLMFLIMGLCGALVSAGWSHPVPTRRLAGGDARGGGPRPPGRRMPAHQSR